MEYAQTAWTDEMLHNEALKYKTRSEYRSQAASAYITARKRKIIDYVCAHMHPVQTSWTDDMLQNEAMKYQTRIEFVRGSFNAYQRAAKREMLDRICGHMERGLRSDDDVIYIWKAVGETYLGEQVYKVGVTSERLGAERIVQVARAHDMTADIVIFQALNKRASKLEKKLLMLGENPNFTSGLDGYSEFRALTEDELKAATSLIELYSSD